MATSSNWPRTCTCCRCTPSGFIPSFCITRPDAGFRVMWRAWIRFRSSRSKPSSRQRARRFRGVPSTPEGETNPVPQLAPTMRGVDVEAHCPNEAFVLSRHREREESALFPGRSMSRDPCLSHSVFVRVGDVLGRQRDLRSPRKPLDGCGIAGLERSEDAPGRAENGKRHRVSNGADEPSRRVLTSLRFCCAGWLLTRGRELSGERPRTLI